MADELDSAEAALQVLRQVIHGIATDDLAKPTPCREFDVAGLTDHLLNSITLLGGAAGAQFPERNTEDSVERQVVAAARVSAALCAGIGTPNPPLMQAASLGFVVLAAVWLLRYGRWLWRGGRR